MKKMRCYKPPAPSLAVAPLAALAVALVLSACTNQRLAYNKPAINALTSTSPLPTSSGLFSIASVTVDDPSSSSSSSGSSTGGTAAGTVRVFVDTVKQTAANVGPLTNYCTTGTGAQCVCQFNWQETNSNSAYTIQIPRQVQTAMSKVQASVVECPTPAKWYLEIPDGTPVTVSLLPAAGGSSVFSTPGFVFTKGTVNTVGGTFRDAMGHAFENIFHYTCYDTLQKGLSLQSRLSPRQVTVTDSQNNQSTVNVNIPMATDFCTAKGNQTPAAGCDGIQFTFDYTAQSYYHDLYTRDGDVGNINGSNSRYVCPKVTRPITASSHSTPNALQTQFYPMDQTFALALASSPDFSVGVDAYTRLAYAGDPVSQASACADPNNTNATTASFDTLAPGCLGFAAKPHSDGSCGTFKDSTGVIRPMFRLRRYVALLPRLFDADGSALAQGQPVNVAYVLDRPVSSGDPQKPYTMLGPKPCPIAFFDQKGVAGATGRRRYVGSNDSGWNGTNIDGTQFPNVDSVNSCSASMGVVSGDHSQITMATISPSNRSANALFKSLFVRPYSSWALHFEEDTDFRACAPQPMQISSSGASSVIVQDPPLHFQKQGNQVAWCAEVYPTQNPNLTQLDPAPANTNGNALLYSSHDVKGVAGVTGDTSCTAEIPNTVSGNYSSTGLSRHIAGSAGAAQAVSDLGLVTNINQTCDRTTVANATYTRIPLLGPAKTVEAALQADTSYACTITYDFGLGKAGASVPTGGCCGGTVQVTPASAVQSAHLEPGNSGGVAGATDCAIPSY